MVQYQNDNHKSVRLIKNYPVVAPTFGMFDSFFAISLIIIFIRYLLRVIYWQAIFRNIMEGF
jgi:hypothetical protein